MRAPTDDADVPRFLGDLGIPGIVDVHVHVLPEPLQRRVWEHFDRLPQMWPIAYRDPDPQRRYERLYELGVVAHTALAYAHRPGMAAWLNGHTLAVAERDDRVVPTFTFYPEDGVDEYVADALERGGRCVKIHLQVGKFDPLDPQLLEVWGEVDRRRLPVILHAGAVDDGSGGEEYCGPEPVRSLLARFPRLRLAIAHVGAPDFVETLEIAEAHPTVHLDVTMAFTEELGGPPQDLLARYLALRDRLVFGSDFPSIPPVALQLQGLVGFGFDATVLRELLWTNPRRFLGLP